MLFATMCISLVLASRDAQAICGVMNSLSLSLKPRNGLSLLIGSSESTSRPAAFMSPSSRASLKSFSTTIGPRPRLRSTASFFIFERAALLMSPSVDAFSGACMDIMSEVARSSSRLTSL